ncbi:monofunctional biosynthetic peptidoglycan transglycosylase [Polymorphum gilvum]|uniref:Biosynthetic peptidoglycan transglycosylase n=1 Tax=Polymorphum gilvum (strain LMG 25793 / CGMCC 1.9160 / SL003B-26A1) TaxID=991905 RepID=F2J0B1_POLGS|nr:monofunctional biosynthetic peptidoglycan transglycosylase [Polymorphum gilvum]ADZ68646.1 Monofunctional biosynthetic peptidoglycan transglycosylase [Polymorphum gilvum SL003B-26A1]
MKPLTLARARRWLLRAAFVLVLLPPALTLLYAWLPAQSTLMLARHVQGLWVDRKWQPLERISPHLVRAVITSEDSGFCSHGGVDWSALEVQIGVLSGGDNPRGASTLTMQLAKNLFLWGGRSYVRKALEIPLAVMIDALLTKRRIAELYLNIAEWGEGIFGAEAAAQAWFGKSAADLSQTEAARLATALPNPLARNPAKPSRAHDRLARTNMARVRVAGAIFDCVLAPR